MSQRLPSRPNLNHLKKQAKDVLRVSRLRNPVWRLADAQHALARGYGFRSWPDLKLHVESARRRRSSRASAAGREPDGTTANRIAAKPTATCTEHRGNSCHQIAGTWATRRLGSMNQGQPPVGDVVVAFELADDILTLTQIVIDPAGNQSAMKMAIRADGEPHPIQFGDGFMLQARWAGVRRLETILTCSEAVVAKGTYEVSLDGQSLIVSTTDHVVVFERV